jgi:type II secretory pathway pseudopilin PulG
MVRRNEAGATLIELMVAMVLLAIALLGLAASFPYAMQGVVAAGYQTTATLLAQQTVDNARFTLYDDLSTLITSGSGSCQGGGGFEAVSGYGTFTRCVGVETATPTANTTTITVVVRFTGTGGMGFGTIWDTTLTTIITR